MYYIYVLVDNGLLVSIDQANCSFAHGAMIFILLVKLIPISQDTMLVRMFDVDRPRTEGSPTPMNDYREISVHLLRRHVLIFGRYIPVTL